MIKNNYRINLILAVLFFVSVTVSAYILFRVPFALTVSENDSSFLTTLYVTLAITFLLGGIAIVRAFQYKEELIVYRERTQEMKQAEEDAAEKKNEISLDSLKNALKESGSQNDIIQNGLNALCKQLGAGQGAFYTRKSENGKEVVELTAGFALSISEGNKIKFNLGEGLIGQAADSGQVLYLDEIPQGYIKIISGLGSASPRFLLVNPLKNADRVIGIIEIATFSALSNEHRKFVEQGTLLISQEMSNQKG